MEIIDLKGNLATEETIETIKIYLKDLDFKIKEKEIKNGFRLKIQKDEFIKNDYIVLSEALMEILIDCYLDKLIIKRVNDIHSHNRVNITDEFIEDIKSDIKRSDSYIDDKVLIRDDLIDYLLENEAINLSGYLIFRLREYDYILDIAIDKVIHHYKKSIQLEEFINMIEYIVEVQESKINVLNVILSEKGFKLTDIDNKEIGLDIVDSVEKELKEVGGGPSDVLLSSLILLSPKRLILHFNGVNKFFLVQAITEIFKDKVIICKGCNICSRSLD